MRTIVIDTSSIISIAVNNLLWTLEPLKKQFDGKFLISESVHTELVDNPIKSKRYKLEAFMIEELINKKIIEVYQDQDVKSEALRLLEILNRSYSIKKRHIKILDLAEVESLIMAKRLGSEAYIVDERTIRLVVENPEQLVSILRDKLHAKIDIDYQNLESVKDNFGDIKILRSAELMLAAHKLGLFKAYTFNKNKRREFIDGLLWALKLHGCSISENEINDMLAYKSL
ncbi:MAG: hypothetical protein AABW41_04450 [Nanoarchaeota archaeon]